MPVVGVEPVIGAGSGDTVGLGIGNAGSIRKVKIAFELFKKINNKKE